MVLLKQALCWPCISLCSCNLRFVLIDLISSKCVLAARYGADTENMKVKVVLERFLGRRKLEGTPEEKSGPGVVALP